MTLKWATCVWFAGTPAGDSQALSLALGAEEARNAVFYGTLIPVVILKYLMGLTLARAVTRWYSKAFLCAYLLLAHTLPLLLRRGTPLYDVTGGSMRS
jgi:hypothetical protein